MIQILLMLFGATLIGLGAAVVGAGQFLGYGIMAIGSLLLGVTVWDWFFP